MEENMGKNLSSGAEKTEKLARGGKSAQPKQAKKTAAKGSKHTTKRAQPRTQKAEQAAAKERVEEAKARVKKQEARRLKRAQLKEKKLEKRAALKQKKLEKRARAMERRAQLKEKKLEKRARRRERRAELKAQRIARREMLAHESKAEKQKRIAREKRQKHALRAQKRSAQEKAHLAKMQARREAQERRAQERRHKREQRTQRKQHARGFGGWLAAVISLGTAALVLSTVVTAGAIRMREMDKELASGYRASLYELASLSEELDDNLSKLRVSSGVEEQRKLVTDALVDAELMEGALERLPVEEGTGASINAFVNRTGEYCRTLLARLATGKGLTTTQKNTIVYLHGVNEQLSSALNDAATHASSGQLRAFLAGKEGELSARFREMAEGTLTAPQDTVDAPFTGEGNVGENKLAALKEVSLTRAEELVKQYLSAYHVREVRQKGETVSRSVAAYNFTAIDENGGEWYVQITKNGGKLLFLDGYQPCSQQNFDLEACDKIAQDFLNSLGIQDMVPVWKTERGATADLTYVFEQDGVRVYADMVRLRVCEERGKVVGMDAVQHLLNHGARTLSPTLTKAEAKARLDGALQVEAIHLALIPAGGEEVLCYEFLCGMNGEEFVVYLDAKTGEEVQVYRVRESARGSYLS